MNSTPLARAAFADPANVAAGLVRTGPSGTAAETPTRAARAVLALLSRLGQGTLDLHAPHGSHHFGGQAAGSDVAGPSLRCHMHVHDQAVYARVLRSGDIGLAEAYVDGQWHTSDLRDLLALFMRNRASLEQAVYGSALGTLAHRLLHWMRRNTRRGSRRNIEAHYDLGNDFYRAWLDPTMNYSSALFADGAQTLADAQRHKVARALDEAGVAAGRRLLEIGCGWGAVAEAAAARGARVVGVTLSREQLDFARLRLQAAGAEADLRLQDYRDLAGECETSGQRYDAIVSIEMFEAVGRRWWPTWFDTLRRCLAPGGRACIQVIVIRDDLFERYVRSTDFIQQYVFPGGLLPSAAAFRAAAAKAGLAVTGEIAFGADYARTLAEWRRAFHAQRAAIESAGFDARFCRLWDFYLAYCEAAFATGQTDVFQFTLRHERDGVDR